MYPVRVILFALNTSVVQIFSPFLRTFHNVHMEFFWRGMDAVSTRFWKIRVESASEGLFA